MVGSPANNTDKSTDAKPMVTSFDEFGIKRVFGKLSSIFRQTRISKRFSSLKIGIFF